MADGLNDFKSLMQRLGDGDVAAAEQVVDRYGKHVTRAIRRRFRSRKMRVLYGTDDCMQSVWGVLFSDVDRVARIETPEHLMVYLSKVAGNKLIDRDRQLRAKYNDVYRECDLPEPESPELREMVMGDLPASQVAAFNDEWEAHTRDLPTRQRAVLDLHRQGHTSDEIARQTDRSSRWVRHMIQQFCEMFRKKSDYNAEWSAPGQTTDIDSGDPAR